ncbi:hypothetical protein FA95DRAFT_1576985 [Auriscalpium vulgare]|uniref:Uncharacterized protein n=1 Tax=Auriscalpium vulgare TaxID=40419 RepID=A0ACB8R928_9AGAM|nr:hypothetical protein FA95DRAFT_1576985 [Auriscalpium vulgare]
MRINSTEPSWKREARLRAKEKQKRDEIHKLWAIGVPGSNYVWQNGLAVWNPERARMNIKMRGMKHLPGGGPGPSRQPPRRPVCKTVAEEDPDEWAMPPMISQGGANGWGTANAWGAQGGWGDGGSSTDSDD